MSLHYGKKTHTPESDFFSLGKGVSAVADVFSMPLFAISLLHNNFLVYDISF